VSEDGGVAEEAGDADDRRLDDAARQRRGFLQVLPRLANGGGAQSAQARRQTSAERLGPVGVRAQPGLGEQFAQEVGFIARQLIGSGDGNGRTDRGRRRVDRPRPVATLEHHVTEPMVPRMRRRHDRQRTSPEMAKSL
jgi:hypothetical protein